MTNASTPPAAPPPNRFALRRGVLPTRGLSNSAPSRQTGIGVVGAGSVAGSGAEGAANTDATDATSATGAAHAPGALGAQTSAGNASTNPGAGGAGVAGAVKAAAQPQFASALERALALSSDDPIVRQRALRDTLAARQTPRNQEAPGPAPVAASAPAPQAQPAPPPRPPNALERALSLSSANDPWRLRKHMAAARSVSAVMGGLLAAGVKKDDLGPMCASVLGVSHQAGQALLAQLDPRGQGASGQDSHATGVTALAGEAVAAVLLRSLEDKATHDPSDLAGLGELAEASVAATQQVFASSDSRVAQCLDALGEQAFEEIKDRATADERVGLSARLASMDIHRRVTSPRLVTPSGETFTWERTPQEVCAALLHGTLTLAREVAQQSMPQGDVHVATTYTQALVRRCADMVGARYESHTKNVLAWVSADPQLTDVRLQAACNGFDKTIAQVLERAREEVLAIEAQADELVQTALLGNAGHSQANTQTADMPRESNQQRQRA